MLKGEDYPAAPGAQDRDFTRGGGGDRASSIAIRQRVLDEFEHSHGLTADEFAARLCGQPAA